ncbi:kinetochore protein NDC80 homolog isoform X2 [Artemia franciscana]|uniref:kinetochore protein NDC80 homolog isoform X2 n=1 Tax=Artemia franciscana TaxID=6661 RepID=UPI0032DACB7E
MRKSSEPAKRKSIPVRNSSLGSRASAVASGKKSGLPVPRTNNLQLGGPSNFKLKRTGSFAADHGRPSANAVAHTPFQTPRSTVFATPGSGLGFSSANKGRAKDGVNYHDKAVQKKLLVKIHDFLDASGLRDAAERFRGTLRLDKKEFVGLFKMFMEHFEGTFPNLHEIEKEVPELLKRLGCHHITFTKASFASIGALHSAGQFIALFAWLIDLVDPLPDQTSDDDVVSYVRRSFQEKVRSLYAPWMKGQENFDAEYNEWILFLDGVGVSQESFESSLNNVRSKREELAKIKDDRLKLQQQSGLAPECEALTKDKNGLQEYLEDIYKYNKEQRAVIERIKQLNAEKRNRLLDLHGQINELKKAKESQPFTKLEFESQRQQLVQLRSEVALEKDTRASIEREIGLSETSYNKALEQCNAAVQNFRSLARSIGLMPQTGDISFDPQEYIGNSNMLERWKNVVQPALRSILLEKKQRLDELLNKIKRIEEEIEEDSAKRDMSQEIVKQSEFDMQFMESAMHDHMQKCQEITEELGRHRKMYAELRKEVDNKEQNIQKLNEMLNNLAAQKEGTLKETSELDKKLGEELVQLTNCCIDEAKKINEDSNAAIDAVDRKWLEKITSMKQMMEEKKGDPELAKTLEEMCADYPVLHSLNL